MKRVIAWVALACFVWGAHAAYQRYWRNPWDVSKLPKPVAASPVLDQLPPLPDGCDKKGCDK